MIIVDLPPVIKRENEQVYWVSSPIDHAVFCNYSEEKNQVQLEKLSGGKEWHDPSRFFRGYPFKKNRYVGLGKNGYLYMYKIGNVETRIIKNQCYLYANLIPTGGSRKYDPGAEKDRPFEAIEHDLPTE